MPLFTDVAGTVRVDCTVSDDDTVVCSVISRSTMFGDSVVVHPLSMLEQCHYHYHYSGTEHSSLPG